MSAAEPGLPGSAALYRHRPAPGARNTAIARLPRPLAAPREQRLR